MVDHGEFLFSDLGESTTRHVDNSAGAERDANVFHRQRHKLLNVPRGNDSGSGNEAGAEAENAGVLEAGSSFGWSLK